MSTLTPSTPIVEPEERLFAHVVRQHRAIVATLAAIREMSARGEHVAACHDMEREADGRPRRSRRQSA